MTRIAALLKTHGWVLNLVFIAAGAYSVAGTINSVVARSLAVVPTAADAPSAAAPRAKAADNGPVDLASIAARNLLGAQRENLHPQPPEENATAQDEPLGNTYRESDLKDCSIPGMLRATMVADRFPEWSIAVVVLNKDHEAAVFNVSAGYNQIAEDVTLTEIRQRSVVVRRRDHFELCYAEGESGAVKPAAPATPPVEAAAPESGEPKGDVPSGEGKVKKTSETEYEIDRNYINETLDNLSQVATQARIVPSFKNGKPNGFKLFSIKPGSVYSHIGMQNGDVIQKINGYEMNSPDKALEIYGKLRESSSVSIELLRRGQPMSFNYNMK